MTAAVNVCIRHARVAGRSVGGGRAIDFKFVVPPAPTASVTCPVCGTDRAVCRAIEFVAPVGCPCNGARRRRGSTLRSSRFRPRKEKSAENKKQDELSLSIRASHHRNSPRREIKLQTSGRPFTLAFNQPRRYARCLRFVKIKQEF